MTPVDTTRVDAIVLGAGISGMVSASVLLEQGAEKVVVVDEYAQVGGNHLDDHVNGYTYDVGSLIFQDDSPLVERFPELMQSYVPIAPTWQRLNPQGKVTAYPFSIRDDVLAAGPIEWARMALSVAYGRVFRRELRNARNFAERWLGRRFTWRTGLLSYMERLCGMPPERIDLQFAESRMGWIPEHARVGRQVRGLWHSRRRAGSLTTPTKNQQLVRPRAGFAALYRPVMERLNRQGAEFVLGSKLVALERDEDGFTLTTASGVVRARRVISTIPLDHALGLIGVHRPTLPTVTLVTLYCSFAGRRGFSSPILYDFAHDGTWKRLTMHSDFYGTHEGREFFAVEVIDPEREPSLERAAEQFREHTAANRLFEGDLRFEGGNILTNAYPVFTAGSAVRAAEAIAELRSFGIESLGRQGGFEYQPTSRRSTHVAERAFGVREQAAP